MTALTSIRLTIFVLFLSWKVTRQNATCPKTFSCSGTPMSCLNYYYSRGNVLHSIPSPLPSFLTGLNLMHQNIPDIEVGDFPLLESMGQLYIQRSGVVNIQPCSFINLPCLTELNLSGNNIRKLKPHTFKGLNNLAIMVLFENKLHSVDKKAFAGLPRLKRLVLNNNCLSSIPQSIVLLKSLRVLSFKNNIKTFPIRVEELKRLYVLYLTMDKIGCDCREREVKKWLLGYPRAKQWHIVCIDKVTEQTKQLKDITLSDMTCPAPEVYVIGNKESRNITGSNSFICQTNCEEGLTFSWILPNGEHSSSSQTYSTNYTYVTTKSSCKGLGVEISETRRMCYAVLNIPVVNNATAGNYTCRVVTNYTKSATVSAVLRFSNVITTLSNPGVTTGFNNSDGNTVANTFQGKETTVKLTNEIVKTTTVRYIVLLDDEGDNFNGPEQSTEVMIYTMLATVFCCCFVFGSAICIKNCRSVSKECGGHGNNVDGNYENDDQFPDSIEATNRHYENDDQFSDEDGVTVGHCKNDDQFPDSIEATNRHYENDDQFPDSIRDTNRHYENEDQFPDVSKATNRHYENDDQFPDANEDTNRHYENEYQFPDVSEATNRHSENDDQFPDSIRDTNRHYENEDQFPDVSEATNRHYENDDQFPDSIRDTNRHYDQDKDETSKGHYGNEFKTKSACKTSQAYGEPDVIQETAPALYSTEDVEE
ncbi:uncharacterized protein [Branchiostoma lanceolatum]|uniref:uncharacterized protein n=1 Tax=Branchiostoma lanceolatum TaxID=7740 RepID=UPI0034562C68